MQRVRQGLVEAEQQLELAKEAHNNEYAGADRWTEHQSATVARLRNLVEIFDDPNHPDGTLIRLATPEIPSQIRFAMEARQELEGGCPKALIAGR